MLEPVKSTLLPQEEDMTSQYDLVCLSHLRWDFVYQRPQHLLSRCAQRQRVFFVEEPVFDEGHPYLHITSREGGIQVAVPHFPMGVSEDRANILQARMIDELFARYSIDNYVLWYYNPLALAFTCHLEPLAIIYDCMDELSAFQEAPALLSQREADLFLYADLVFTGGQSLYEAKRHRHKHVYAFPSSVDTSHFAQARVTVEDPPDQASIPHPRLGFYGVIEERMDLDLLRDIADAQPDWHLVLVGPVIKIDPDTLPRRKNIHYLERKSYNDLPAYLAGWDVAIMPFAHNASTRFISPTKTLEYLAGGKPVVSTSIRDVVYPYAQQGLVYIADKANDFITAVKRAMEENHPKRLREVDTFLSQTSWDSTWASMRRLIEDIVTTRQDWPAYSLASSRFSPAALSVDTSAAGGLA